MDILILMSILLWCFATNSCMSLPLQFLGYEALSYQTILSSSSLGSISTTDGPCPSYNSPRVRGSYAKHINATPMGKEQRHNSMNNMSTFIKPASKPEDDATISASPNPAMHG